MPMELSVMEATEILNRAADAVTADLGIPEHVAVVAVRLLTHAITHINRPERDVYPKTRKGNKTRPVKLDYPAPDWDMLEWWRP